MRPASAASRRSASRPSSSARSAGGGAFQGEGQQQRRPGGQHVLAGRQLVVGVAVPVLEVVEDLECDAEVLAEVGDGLLVGVGRPGEADAGVQGGLEGGGRLEGVNLQGVQGGQRLVLGVAPEQFGALALRQLQVGVGEPVEDVGGAVAAEFLALAADEAIAEAEQVIADVDGRAARRTGGAASRGRSGRCRRPRCRRGPATPCETPRWPGRCGARRRAGSARRPSACRRRP